MVVDASPSPARESRYDRQLRLWGDHGQSRLEAANVALLNATGTGTEILKNLVLPGIGRFTIVDGENVKEEDFHNNFFISPGSLGKPRGEVSCRALQEMNKEVKGTHVMETPEQLISNNISLLDEFTLVIGSNLAENVLLCVGAYLWDRGIPFVVCRSYGLTGYLRLVFEEHTIIESKPENSFPDFRLDEPFESFLQLVRNTNLDAMTHREHSHVPFLVLLCKYLEEWKVAHPENLFPETYKEKKQFKEFILSKQVPDDKGVVEEENFIEAANAVNTAIIKTSVPMEVEKVLSCAKVTELTKDSSAFWIMCNGLRKFIENEGGGKLPLQGTLPDMISDSGNYVSLLNLFRSKALEDAKTVYEYIQHSLKSIEGVNFTADQISLEDVKLFCKNAHFIRALFGGSLKEEYQEPKKDITSLIQSELIERQNVQMLLYLLIRAADRFFVEMNRFPGFNGIPITLDKNDLRSRLYRVLESYGLNIGNIKFTEGQEAYMEEICRYASIELPTTAAILGGIGAQEIIKLITHQYVPINNTFVFNGVTGESSVFAF